MTEEGLVVKPAVREKSKLHFPYTEKELLAEITPEKAHADAVAQPAGPETGDQTASSRYIPARREVVTRLKRLKEMLR